MVILLLCKVPIRLSELPQGEPGSPASSPSLAKTTTLSKGNPVEGTVITSTTVVGVDEFTGETWPPAVVQFPKAQVTLLEVHPLERFEKA